MEDLEARGGGGGGAGAARVPPSLSDGDAVSSPESVTRRQSGGGGGSSSLRRRGEERSRRAPLVEEGAGAERRSEMRPRLLQGVGELGRGHGLAFGDLLCHGLAVGAQQEPLSRRRALASAIAVVSRGVTRAAMWT